MEQLRHQMRARNKLVIVRDADESLRIPLSKRLKVKLTQPMSDQLVVHQIGDFIKDALDRQRQKSVRMSQDTSADASSAIEPSESVQEPEPTPVTEETAGSKRSASTT